MKKCHNKLFKTKLSGVSLVELLVVSAITVMVMLTIARLFQRSMRDAVRAREMEAAERVMSEMMTELRKTEFVFVMPADSLKKGGAPNINSHNSAFSDYNVSWVQSPMLAVLNRLEVLVRSGVYVFFNRGGPFDALQRYGRI